MIGRSTADVKGGAGRGRGKGGAGKGGAGGDKPTVDRGWATGTVGWGVLGSFGSNEKVRWMDLC